MKILAITAQKPHSTGSGTYLTEIVNNSGTGSAYVFCTDGDRLYDQKIGQSLPGISMYPVKLSYPVVGMSDLMPYESTRYRDMTAAKIAEFEDKFIEEIERAVKECAPDILLCNHLFLLTALVRKHFPELKVYGICHGTCLRQMRNAELSAAEGKPWSIDIEMVRENIAKLDRIFALHEQQAEEIAEIFGAQSAVSIDDLRDKITVVGSGYNADLFNTQDRIDRLATEPVRICYAGKISTPKGVPELLQAISELEPSTNIQLTLVGGCQDEEMKKTLASLPPYIQYLGPLPQEELAKVYKKNDILVLPSYFEGLSLVPIEAMACGLIPVCTDLPGMKPWINENVLDSTVRYIPRPEMATIDSPTARGREQFIQDLKAILGQTIDEIAQGKTFPQPDTSKITWEEIAKKFRAQ